MTSLSDKLFDTSMTITYGEVAENHIGNQKIGSGKVDRGFSLENLQVLARFFHTIDKSSKKSEHRCETRIVHLNDFIDTKIEKKVENAYVLIIRNGVNVLLKKIKKSADDMFEEHNILEKDSKYFDIRRQKVLNKHARHNLCFNFHKQNADYENKKGTIIPFTKVPCTHQIQIMLVKALNSIEYDGNVIKAEGNYYYDLKKCGISFHGDTERRIVIGIRLGASIPLHYQWFYKSKPIGERCKLELGHGDIYIMSDKAVGYDWKKRIIPTLRHAAGAEKYLTIKKKETPSAKISDKVENPETGKMITVGKGIYNSLLMKGYKLVDNKLEEREEK